MFRKFRTALAVAGAVILIATGFTAASTASAAATASEGWDDCARGTICLWDQTGFGGEKILEWKPLRHGELYNFPDSASDRALSVRNNSPFKVRLHNLHNAIGVGHHCFPSWSGHGDLGLLGLDRATRSATTPYHC